MRVIVVAARRVRRGPSRDDSRDDAREWALDSRRSSHRCYHHNNSQLPGSMLLEGGGLCSSHLGSDHFTHLLCMTRLSRLTDVRLFVGEELVFDPAHPDPYLPAFPPLPKISLTDPSSRRAARQRLDEAQREARRTRRDFDPSFGQSTADGTMPNMSADDKSRQQLTQLQREEERNKRDGPLLISALAKVLATPIQKDTGEHRLRTLRNAMPGMLVRGSHARLLLSAPGTDDFEVSLMLRFLPAGRLLRVFTHMLPQQPEFENFDITARENFVSTRRLMVRDQTGVSTRAFAATRPLTPSFSPAATSGCAS